MTIARGQHFLQIPGPSPVPERVMRAMDQQVIELPDAGPRGRFPG